MRKIITGGIAVTLGVATALAGSAFAGSSAGKPTDTSRTICGVGNAPTTTPDGQSGESKFGGASFSAGASQGYQQPCTADNSSAGTSNTWTIVHGNVATDPTERGTEHGQYTLEDGAGNVGGFNGHVTDFDFNGGDVCQDNAGRSVYYESGTENDPGCPPDFGPVGNFNTHGGAATGNHTRGHYGTLIFQQPTSSGLPGPCDVNSQKYCIQIDLFAQTN